MQIKEALQMQLQVQRHLHQQFEIQQKLQLRIEEQGKQWKMIFDQQQRTTRSLLNTQNSSISSPGDDPSHPYDDTEVLDAEHCDNTHFPFQSFLLAGASKTRNSPNNVVQIDSKTGMQIKEALQMQLEVQRHLHEQLEIRQKLQLRIEEQGKQLKMMFDQQ
ncbi:myb family transcription factor PHL8-like [Nicotiana tomentosiformis]|uniref:myb family transcription factor PHL8-like n=1 Tax=Nicotiana tomentosiformis TaxID=4098 RepID=UPI00388C730A